MKRGETSGSDPFVWSTFNSFKSTWYRFSVEDYPWTSFHTNALGISNPLIHPHAEYLNLGRSAEERQAAYRELFKAALSDDQLLDIRTHLQQQRALGSNRFQAAIEAQLGRIAKVRPHGRPKNVL